MLEKAFSTFPVNFCGFKLLKCMGGGFISDVYLAESPEGLGLPLKVCLKLATNKINLDQYGDDDTSGVDIPGRYTRKSATRDFRYQKQILAQMRHPFIVKAYSHVLQEIPDCIVTEAGVCTMEGLQASLNFQEKRWSNHFHPIAFKYFAAQIFLALDHLHEHNIKWTDAKQENIIVMADFTLRLIDIGGSWSHTTNPMRDPMFLTGALISMGTTWSEAFMYLELVEYQEILSRTRFEMDSELHDLLVAFLAAKPVRELLQHPYWTSAKDGQLGVDLDSIREAGRETEGLRDLASCAWRMLPSSSQQWLSQKGVQQVSEVAVI